MPSTRTATEARLAWKRAARARTWEQPVPGQTRCSPLTLSAEAPLVVAVVVRGRGTPQPHPVLQDTLLVALPVDDEGEHTGVPFLGFWKEERRVAQGANTTGLCFAACGRQGPRTARGGSPTPRVTLDHLQALRASPQCVPRPSGRDVRGPTQGLGTQGLERQFLPLPGLVSCLLGV